MLLELVGVVFGPLGRAEQRRLFAIPEAIDDGAGGLPALLEQLAESACFFELGAGPEMGSSAPLTQAS